LPSNAQSGASTIEAYFTGKEVILKINMPGTQTGVDLRFNKATPMDWKEYSGRINDDRCTDARVAPDEGTAIFLRLNLLRLRPDDSRDACGTGVSEWQLRAGNLNYGSEPLLGPRRECSLRLSLPGPLGARTVKSG
jgi:hypothetical protein